MNDENSCAKLLHVHGDSSTLFHRLARGVCHAGERQSVPEFLSRWIRDVARTRVWPQTLVGYQSAIVRHISHFSAACGSRN
jgi:hypothetical protein